MIKIKVIAPDQVLFSVETGVNNTKYIFKHLDKLINIIDSSEFLKPIISTEQLISYYDEIENNNLEPVHSYLYSVFGDDLADVILNRKTKNGLSVSEKVITLSEKLNQYQIFKFNTMNNIDEYRECLKNDGTYEFVKWVKQLQKFSNKINHVLFVDWFGEQLGSHLWNKFINSDRNFLTFLNGVNDEYLFFILYKIKNGS